MEDETSPASPVDMRLADLWAMVQIQRRVIVLVICLALGLGLAYSLTATSMYRSTAVLHLSPLGGSEVQVDQVVDLDQQQLRNTNMFLRTQVEILRSRSLREEVVKRHAELGYPEVGASSLGRLLSVTPRQSSQLIDVAVTHTDPQQAAVLANLVTEVYREMNLDGRRDAAREARSWLAEQLVAYEARIDETSARLLEFQAEHDLADAAEERITNLHARMESINLAYGAQNTERVLLDTTLRQYERLLEAGDYGELAKELNTPLLASLNQDYSRALAEHARVAARYGERHPERQYAEAKLQRLQEEMNREVERTLAALRVRLDIARSKESDLRSEIDAIKEELLGRQARLQQYHRVRHEYERARDQYKKLQIRNDELDLSARTQLNNVRVVDAAVAGERPVSPRLLLNLLIALGFGVVAGFGVAFLREFLHDTIRSPLDITAYLRVPYLGLVPRLERVVDEKDQALYTQRHPNSSAAEAMRALRTVLELNPSGEGLRRLLVTSAVSSEGKTSTIVRLGVAFANLGRRVVMVDADLRRPRIHKIFGIERDVGLTSAIAGASLDEVIQPTEIPNLDFISAGPSAERPNELLASTATTQLLDELALRYDLVLIDTPPAVLLSDAAILSKVVDGVVLVVRENTASRMLIRDAIQRLAQVGANLLGVVVNAADLAGNRASYRYYYGYQYKYDKYYDDGSQRAAK